MSLYGEPRRTENRTESLFEHVARHNGPLNEYHPQMILQCLLWGAASPFLFLTLTYNRRLTEKIELVKNIIVNLAKNLERTKDVYQWEPLPFGEYLKRDEATKAVCLTS